MLLTNLIASLAASMLSGLNAGNQGASPVARASGAAGFNAVRLERRKSGCGGAARRAPPIALQCCPA